MIASGSPNSAARGRSASQRRLSICPALRRCRRLVVAGLTLAAGLAAGRTRAETVILPPSYTTSDRLDLLLSPSRPDSPELAVRLAGRGDTNVMPLAAGGKRASRRATFGGAAAYFTAFTDMRLALRMGGWQLAYAHGWADLYEGNRDAAQLYLDSLSESIDLRGTYRPAATMSRGSVTTWRVSRSIPIRTSRGAGALQLAVGWLRTDRLQLGRLCGDTVDGQFAGTLDLITTRGLPGGQAAADGFALDIACAGPLADRLRGGLWVENAASRIWQRRIQDIRSAVVTNTLIPDGDGFLHGAPALAGTIGSRSALARARPRVSGMVAYGGGSRAWLFAADDAVGWRVALGAASGRSRTERTWCLLWAAPFEWQAGSRAGGLTWQLGMSSLEPGRAYRATAEIGWTFDLRSR